MKVLCVLKDGVLPDVRLILNPGGYAVTDGVYVIGLSKNQATGIAEALSAHFADVDAKDAEPAEDTVALLCAAARKWAKWDARFQAAACDGVPMTDTLDGLLAKAKKWMNRTLSYGHHLLSAGVPGNDVWTLEEMEAMRAKKAPPLDFNRIGLDYAADLKRLDTLVQQLCARVANLEEASNG